MSKYSTTKRKQNGDTNDNYFSDNILKKSRIATDNNSNNIVYDSHKKSGTTNATDSTVRKRVTFTNCTMTSDNKSDTLAKCIDPSSEQIRLVSSSMVTSPSLLVTADTNQISSETNDNSFLPVPIKNLFHQTDSPPSLFQKSSVVRNLCLSIIFDFLYFI